MYGNSRVSWPSFDPHSDLVMMIYWWDALSNGSLNHHKDSTRNIQAMKKGRRDREEEEKGRQGSRDGTKGAFRWGQASGASGCLFHSWMSSSPQAAWTESEGWKSCQALEKTTPWLRGPTAPTANTGRVQTGACITVTVTVTVIVTGKLCVVFSSQTRTQKWRRHFVYVQ